MTNDEQEQALINRARQSVTSCNWQLGECAHLWTVGYAKGRTDIDFAALVGRNVQVGHVGRCRRVWADFAVKFCQSSLEKLQATWKGLSWSHFDKARSFQEHAVEALDWAAENDGTIRMMQAWAWETWPELKSLGSGDGSLEQEEEQEIEEVLGSSFLVEEQSKPVHNNEEPRTIPPRT